MANTTIEPIRPRTLKRTEILRLASIDKQHPLSLCVDVETRRLLESLIESSFYTIQPEARTAITEALKQTDKISVPIMPCTSFEHVAYADHLDNLECIASGLGFTAGRKYPLTTGSYRFTTEFTRNKVHFNEETQETYTRPHECRLSGQDRFIRVIDDNGERHRFMDKPDKNDPHQHDESLLWQIFQKPEVKTVKDVNPEAIAQNLAVLRSCEKLCGYQYYPGQLEYLARVGVKDYGYIAAATGCGKSLFALSMIAMKSPNRCLIIAPQGTLRSSSDEDDEGEEFNAAQWVTEIARFAPYLQIYELFSYADYQRICSLNGGVLPMGCVVVSYFQAMFSNGARESCPDTWDDKRLEKELRSITGKPVTLPMDEGQELKHHCDTIGKEYDGIRCIMQPCLATLIGHEFDMVLVDEAQFVTNLDANVTQMLIRLQPKYRYAFTATPIPNIVSNLFSVMGWLSVDGWFRGGMRNAAWPYAREELNRFNETFLSVERDLTEEAIRAEKDRNWRGKCIKESPVISSPARLLKLLKPTMAYISKQACNPAYQEAKVVDVRVPMGKEQAVLYNYFMDRSNIPANHPLVRARKQTAWLRGICADPHGFRHGGPRVSSNMNPKMIATLELCRDLLAKGEQVLIVSARVGFTDSLQDRLADSGVPLCRIDSTVSAEQHTHQANLFKSGKARVCLMGLKCAASHSFSHCIYTIITSLEFSPGSLNQARGRTDRVNSRPGVTIYCILHQHSIEEVIFDVCMVKDDAATICLKGKRVPREFKPVDASEILAQALNNFDLTGAKPEVQCEDNWPLLQAAIRKAVK